MADDTYDNPLPEEVLPVALPAGYQTEQRRQDERRDSITSSDSLRSSKSILQVTLDPFAYTDTVTKYECLKRVLVSFTLFPLRLVIFVFAALLAWLIALLGTYGAPLEEDHNVWKHNTEFPRWRAVLLAPLIPLYRIVLWCFGFWRIRVVDRRKDKTVQAHLMVVAPHVSMIDMLVMMYVFPGSGFVGLQAVVKIPLARNLGTATQGIFIDATDDKSRESAKAAIERRASTKWPGRPISIFPEGTITNGQALVQFRTGAFLPGKPVLPVLLRYPSRHWNLAWVGKNRNPTWAVRLMLQVANHCVVEILDTYYPSAEEQADPKAYANAVRNKMARKTGLPQTNHSYSDAALYHVGGACEAKVSADFEVQDAKKMFGLDKDKLEACLQSFKLADCDKDGRISYEDFVASFQLTNSPVGTARDLFDFMDTDSTEFLGFREFVQLIGMLRRDDDVEGRKMLAWLTSRAYNVQGLRSRDAVAVVSGSESSEHDAEDTQLALLAVTEFNKLAEKYPEIVDHLLGYLRDHVSIQGILSEASVPDLETV